MARKRPDPGSRFVWSEGDITIIKRGSGKPSAPPPKKKPTMADLRKKKRG